MTDISNATLLAEYKGYRMYEHPLYGDEVPAIVVTPRGKVIENSGAWDVETFEESVDEHDFI